MLREKQRLRWEEKGEYYSTRRLKSESNTLERQNGQELMGYSDPSRGNDAREKSKEYGKDIKGKFNVLVLSGSFVKHFVCNKFLFLLC